MHRSTGNCLFVFIIQSNACMHEDISIRILYTTKYSMALKFGLIEHTLRKWICLLSNVLCHLFASIMARSFPRTERFHVVWEAWRRICLKRSKVSRREDIRTSHLTSLT